MRIVMVGGGVIGLLTAMTCVSAGHEVVVVDQADIPFSGATSFDRHRTVRALHPGNPGATAAAVRAHHWWLGLESVLSTTFYEQVGALSILPADQLDAARTMLMSAGSVARVLTPAELAAAHPHIRFPVGASAVAESHAGVLLADRVLAVCADWLRWHSRAELHPHRAAVDVDPDRATVRLAGGAELTADAVLLAVGPWSRRLLPPRLAGELVLRRQSMVYCDVPDATAWSTTPAILGLGADNGAWLVPPVAGTPLKLSAASACRIVPDIGDNTTAAHWRNHLTNTFGAILSGVSADRVADTRDCYYLARASTGGSMCAVLGERVVCYAACGGSSFKFAPVIARHLAERLTRVDPMPTGLDPLDNPIVAQADP